MFTGIIEELGAVRTIEMRGENARIVISARVVTEGTNHGDSIAVNGVCLTALDIQPDSFAADVSRETLMRSTLGNLTAGTPVNLERAVTPATRLGGHIVQGHVDGVGEVERVQREGDALLMDVALPADLAELLVPHGSITIDGVSLTVNDIPAPRIVQLSLIEYTLRHTTLGALVPGDPVHVEGDVIGKYVRRLMEPYLSGLLAHAKAGGPGKTIPDSNFPTL